MLDRMGSDRSQQQAKQPLETSVSSLPSGFPDSGKLQHIRGSSSQEADELPLKGICKNERDKTGPHSD